MGVKISDLTAKGSKIASTDIIEVSVDTGSSFVSRKVTGSELNEVSLDTSPQLGGDLDVNGYKITSDSDQDVIINPNGVGITKVESNLHLRDTSGATAPQINLYEGFSNGSNYIGIKAPNSLSADTTYTLPTADGTSGQVLSTNGTGTLSWATAGGGITVGTTAVTSGTDGRVFFQAVGVVQQDANFTFDNTLKRLTLKAVGTAATDIPFAVQNSAGTVNLLQQNGVGSILARSNDTFSYAGLFYRSDGANGFSLTNSHSGYGQGTGIETVGNNLYFLNTNTRALSVSTQGTGTFKTYGIWNYGSGSGQRLLIGENVFDPQVTLSGTGNLGIGTYTAGARLDVRAQGALSTDIAFRVRNSADSANLLQVSGDGGFIFRNNANTKFFYWDASNLFQFGTVGGQALNIDVQSTAITRIETTLDILLEGVSTHKFIQYKNGNFQLEEASGIAQTSGAGGFSMKNAATVPSANSTDRFIMYGADITAGNAAPHFRTENGNIIKLYRETTAVAAATLVGNAGTNITDTDTFDGYTLQQVVKALKNLGILA